MLERARSHLLRSLAATRGAVTRRPELLRRAVEIASRESPSRAFIDAGAVYEAAVAGSANVAERLAYQKLTRWLAVVRRDYPNEFKNVVSELESLVQTWRGGADPDDGAAGRAAGVEGEGWPVRIGIYVHGSYDWLGQERLDKIDKILRARHNQALPKELAQLALEVFHSLYLLDTSLRRGLDPALAEIAEATEPLRRADIRRYTVLSELPALLATAQIMSVVVDKWREYASQERAGGGRPTVSGFCRLLKDGGGVEGLVKAVEGEVERQRKAVKIIDALGRKAGVGHRLGFDEKIRLADILSRYEVFTEEVLRAITTTDEKRPGRTGGTAEFKGFKRMEEYAEISRIRVTEAASPDLLFKLKLLTKDIAVREYGEGSRGRRRKYIVLIDKSGSMAGPKLEKAKAVALGLLLRPETDDVKVAFFDYKPWPDEPVSLREDTVRAIETIVRVVGDGGTRIDAALAYADEKAPNHTIVLITDGEDKVTYKPRNRLVAVMVDGDNETLMKNAAKYIRASDIVKSLAGID